MLEFMRNQRRDKPQSSDIISEVEEKDQCAGPTTAVFLRKAKKEL
jgi:hypothetical protein